MKSFTERNPTIIGLLVIALIVSGTGAALLLNGGFFKKRYQVRAIFTDTAGLRTGDKIRVAGVSSGEVGGLRERGGKVEVDLKVDKSVKLPHDTRAEIVVETLLGNKYVRLVAGHDWDRPLESGSILRDTRTPTEVLDLQDIGTPLLENLDGKSLNDLLGKIDRISSGQRSNVGDIITGLSRLTVAINQRQTEARRLIDSTRTVTGTLARRDQDLLRSIDQINVVVDGLAQRRVQLAALLDQTAQTAKKTADLVATNRPQLDAILDELHVDLAIVGRRQGELAASMSGLSNALGGFASIGYSGKDEVPNTWANMYTQLLGPISPDAVFGSCGLLDDSFDILVGPDPIKNCADRTGPLPSSGGTDLTNAMAAPGGAGSGAQPASTNPLDSIYGPLAGGGS